MPDSELADKIRYLLSPESGFTERKMFGGLCFMVGGHMTCGITGEGDLMLRIGPAAYESALLEAGVRPMDFTGRPMKGMVFVDPKACESGENDLATWIGRALEFTKSLPPKKK